MPLKDKIKFKVLTRLLYIWSQLNNPAKLVLFCSIFLLPAVLKANSASSLDTVIFANPNWIGGMTTPGSNSWMVAGNWSTGIVPGSTDTVTISGNSYVDFQSQPNQSIFCVIGAGGNTGTLLIKDGATFNLSSSNPYNNLMILGGTNANGYGTGNLIISSAPDAVSTVNGTILYIGSTDIFTNGLSNQAYVTIENGGLLNSQLAGIGYGLNSTANVTVTGEGSLWTNLGSDFGISSGIMEIGSNGNGSMNITDHGKVISKSVYLNAGYAGTGNAAVTVDHSGSWVNTGKLYVGYGLNYDFISDNGTNLAALNIVSNGIVDVGDELTIAYVGCAPGQSCNCGNDINACNVRSAGTLNLGNAGSQGGGTGTLITKSLVGGLGTKTVNIDGGILQANSSNVHLIDGFTGTEFNIMNGGLIIDTDGHEVDTGNANVISGVGSLTKIGIGTLTLNGNHTYTGDTIVKAGTLNLQGTLISKVILDHDDQGNYGAVIFDDNAMNSLPMTVNQGGRLQGNHKLGDTTIKGTIAPGDFVGKIEINGDFLQQADAVYEVDLGSGDSGSDLIEVTGKATLEKGAKIKIMNSQTILFNATYKILTAVQGVFGQYDNIEFDKYDAYPLLKFGLAYGDDNGDYTEKNSLIYNSPTNVYLRFNRSNIPFSALAKTPNQAAAASGIESLGSEKFLYNKITLLNTTEAAAVFNDLSGEIHASLSGVLLDQSSYPRDRIINRLNRAIDKTINQPTNKWFEGLDYWLNGFGTWGKNKGNVNAAKLNDQTGGFYIGFDKNINKELYLGVLAGYSNSQIEADSLASTARIANYQFGLYGSNKIRRLQLNLGSVYSLNRINTKRQINFSAINEQLNTKYNGYIVQGFAEASYPLVDSLYNQVKPFLQAAVVRIQTDRFKEQDAETALFGLPNQQAATFSTIGSHLMANLSHSALMKWDAKTTLGWRHTYSGIIPTAKLNFIGGIPFTVTGSPLAEDALMIDAGISGIQNTPKPWQVTLAYTGQVARQVKDHGLRGELKCQFD